jgi:hypothetical protein
MKAPHWLCRMSVTEFRYGRFHPENFNQTLIKHSALLIQNRPAAATWR